jgi:hypothetical protein
LSLYYEYGFILLDFALLSGGTNLSAQANPLKLS